MSQHKVDSSSIVSGVFDETVLPSIFAKIDALTAIDKKQTAEAKAALKPNRYFRVSVKAGQEPELIAADTLKDALAQASDIARHEKGTVIQFYEVFPLSIPGNRDRLNALTLKTSFHETTGTKKPASTGNFAKHLTKFRGELCHEKVKAAK